MEEGVGMQSITAQESRDDPEDLREVAQVELSLETLMGFCTLSSCA